MIQESGVLELQYGMDLSSTQTQPISFHLDSELVGSFRNSRYPGCTCKVIEEEEQLVDLIQLLKLKQW